MEGGAAVDCERPGMGRAVDTEEENGGAAGGKSASGDVVASYLPLVDFLAEVLGPTAEVVLHDLRRQGHSMVAIRNGELTGRRAGDATATEAALRMARRAEERGEPYAANYFGQPAGDKILRSSTYFIRDEKRNVVGILGVNVDLTQLMAARQTVDRLLGLEKSGGVPAVPFVGESRGPRRDEADRNVEHMVYSVLERVLSACKAAPSRLTAREKREVVEELNARGVFLLKGVVTEVARRLSVSEQTVYRYLKG